MRPRRRQLKSPAAEAAQFRRRALLGFVLVVLALGGLGAWYYKLQVVDHAGYALQSEANRLKLRPVLPGRGLILDRKGRVLADNVPAYRLDVTPMEAGPTAEWLPELRRIVALDADDLAEFEEARRAGKRFRPITLKPRLEPEEVARFAVDRWRFPGVELVPYLNRRYPHGPLLAHVIGYVGRVDEEDLKELGEANSAFTHVGQTGIERYYDDILRGRIGYEQVETNVEGRSLGTVGRVPAVPGTDIRLSIDLDLQRAMVAAFGDFDGSESSATRAAITAAHAIRDGAPNLGPDDLDVKVNVGLHWGATLYGEVRGAETVPGRLGLVPIGIEERRRACLVQFRPLRSGERHAGGRDVVDELLFGARADHRERRVRVVRQSRNRTARRRVAARAGADLRAPRYRGAGPDAAGTRGASVQFQARPAGCDRGQRPRRSGLSRLVARWIASRHRDHRLRQRHPEVSIGGWKRKGWMTSTGQPAVNRDLWEELDALATKCLTWARSRWRPAACMISRAVSTASLSPRTRKSTDAPARCSTRKLSSATST